MLRSMSEDVVIRCFDLVFLHLVGFVGEAVLLCLFSFLAFGFCLFIICLGSVHCDLEVVNFILQGISLSF